MNDIKRHVDALRQLMKAYQIDAFITPSTDPHSGEYVPSRWYSREWISGFNGSAGTAVVTINNAALWTDSRYFLHAEEQLKDTGFTLQKDKIEGTPTISEWIGQQVEEGGCVGVDGWTNTVESVKSLKKELSEYGLSLRTDIDPYETIWTDRPSLPDDKVEECAYYNLTCVGAKHSGDIRSIPEKVGTAEYIELSLPELEAAGAKYATFTCNAYSTGALSPNLVVGWMDSANKMKISEKKGVAYDSSCVQHMVRISESNLSKGLVFGVLDVMKREIIWLEMPFTAQTLRGADSTSIETLLHKFENKLSIGELLDMKAKAQGLTLTEDTDNADEVYTYEWALNPADVSKLLDAQT